MTQKQQAILESALALFAQKGYNAVSTASIAADAGVSEGLIFRHFKNKRGLLDAIMVSLEERIQQAYTPFFFESDPKAQLRMVIGLPFAAKQDEYGFWKLVFKLKWDEEFHVPGKMEPVLNKLAETFEALGYANPRAEAELLNHTMESITSHILREGLDTQVHLHQPLLERYGL